MRLFWKLLVVLLLVLPISSFQATHESRAAEQPQRPNIVFVVADDLDQRTTDDVRRLRALVGAKGVTFENSFVTNSLCCPSRATALRGQYSNNHGVLTNEAPLGAYGRFEKLGRHKSTVATWLKDSGYRNGFFGRYLNQWGFRGTPQPGWDRFMHSSPTDNRYWEYGGWKRYPQNAYKDNVITDKAARFIRRNARNPRPLFVAVWLHAPHAPHEPPGAHRLRHDDTEMVRSPSYLEEDLSDKPRWVRDTAAWAGDEAAVDARIEEKYRRRLEQTEGVADNVATLIRTLAETRELDNTYLVFTSDNGYMLGEHYLPPFKMPPYEESIRVPLMVRGPGVQVGVTRRELVTNNDLAPTFADWANAKTPSWVDGRSFVPLAKGRAVSWRKSFLVEHWGAYRPQNGRPAIPTYSAVRTANHLYVEYKTGEKELYDLAADPYQLDNAAGSADPGTLKRLSTKLRGLKACAGASCRKVEGG